MTLATPQQRSRRDVDQGRRQISQLAGAAVEARISGLDAQRMRLGHEAANAGVLRDDTAFAVAAWVGMLVPVVGWAVDAWIFSPLAQELITSQGGSPFTAILACLALTGLLVLLETYIGMARAYESESQFGGPGARRMFLTILGVLLALSMPALIAGTQVAAYLALEQPDRTAALMTTLLTLALVAISLGFHLLLVFGGQYLYPAKTYVFARMRQRRLQSREDDGFAGYRRLSRQTWDTYVRYRDAVQQHNAQFGPVEMGPFDPETVDILNRQREERQEGFPPQLPPTGPAAPPPAPQAPPPDQPAPPRPVAEEEVLP